MTDQRNLILAIVLSVAIIFAFQFFLPQQPKPPAEQTQTQTQPGAKPGTTTGTAPVTPGGPALPGQPAGKTEAVSRSQALTGSERVAIESSHVNGSIALTGGLVDDLVLRTYHQTVDPTSPNIELLNPPAGPDGYFAEFGWVGAGDLKLPDRTTKWQADTKTLKPGQPVTLSWDNGQGLKFSRVYAIDDDYMVTVTQRVTNGGSAPVTIFPYGLVTRYGTPKTSGFFILHEGPLGVFRKEADSGGSLTELSYKDLEGDKHIEEQSYGGWLGFTDHYWLVALIPDQAKKVTARFSHNANGGVDRYQVDYRGDGQTLAPGATIQATDRMFAGAKEVKLLDGYADKLGIAKFDLAIDFGWFYFLTKPLFLLLQYIHSLVGNFGIAIMTLTVLVKLCFFPLANKSYAAMGRMKALQPKMLELRERFQNDKQRLNQEMMALYKREKVNPMAGCLPIAIQIPVFFALYKVLFVTIEMRHAPFFGWIRDLSAPDPTTVLNLFGLLPYHIPDLGMFHIISIGAWPLIMGVTMFLQQKLNPAPPDPVQARVFMLLPIIFTFMLAHFPAGLVIYWSWNNTLSIAQQWIIMKRHGVSRRPNQPTAPAKKKVKT
ncbi:MAG TPA: membrane protein insertase YidC [Alphaproteobacteria bacterium]|nr:membrane protein insertase YidC [Alphaproteobacteria bacterium]